MLQWEQSNHTYIKKNLYIVAFINLEEKKKKNNKIQSGWFGFIASMVLMLYLAD